MRVTEAQLHSLQKKPYCRDQSPPAVNCETTNPDLLPRPGSEITPPVRLRWVWLLSVNTLRAFLFPPQ